jgi:hypothetical protein
MNISCFLFCPKTPNFRAFSRRHRFELVSGPRTDFRPYVSVPLPPHLRPKHSEKCWNLLIPVQFSQEEEVTVLGFIEEKVPSFVFHVVLMARKSG